MSIVETQQPESDCPECGGNLTNSKGETYCQECGVVIDENLPDLADTARVKDPELNVGRGQTSSAMHDKGLGSQISHSDTDADSKIIASNKRGTFKRLRQVQSNKQYNAKQRNKRSGMGEIHRLVSAMDLPEKLLDPSGKLFNQAHEKELSVGLSLDGIADACVFITARIHGNIRDMDEWLEHITVNERDFKTALGKVQTELDIGYLPPKPTDYVDRFVDGLDLLDKERKKVLDLSKRVESSGVHSGRKPQGVVAAVIYLSTDYLTQEEICDEVGVSPITLRKSMYAIQDSEVDV